jgi:hypothetical protein
MKKMKKTKRVTKKNKRTDIKYEKKIKEYGH